MEDGSKRGLRDGSEYRGKCCTAGGWMSTFSRFRENETERDIEGRREEREGVRVSEWVRLRETESGEIAGMK